MTRSKQVVVLKEEIRDKAQELKEKIAADVERIQNRRLAILGPKNYLPEPWKPLYYDKPREYYKVVACVDGKLLSVYDGTYEYSLHKWNLCKAGANAHPPLWTALWVYPTLQQAVDAVFPPDSALLDAPRVLLHVIAKGRGFKHPDTNVYTFSELKPIRVISHLPPGGSPWIPAEATDGAQLTLKHSSTGRASARARSACAQREGPDSPLLLPISC